MAENKKVTVKAPAKINLTLNIGDKRPDGYHNVKMIMQAIDLYDLITVSLNKSGKITVSCNNSNVPVDESNLVYKAAQAFYKENTANFTGVHINIEKNIPMQAGLAGGSTDCAATLLALNSLHGSILNDNHLKNIGAALGADVPFCFDGGTMLATDIGTTLKKIYDMPKCPILLVKPNIGVSTKEAYAKADARTSLSEDKNENMINALKNQDLNAVSKLLYNDFQDLLGIPQVNAIIEKLLKSGADGACMSGSGPTVYGVFECNQTAHSAYKELKSLYNDVFLCTPVGYGCKIIP